MKFLLHTHAWVWSQLETWKITSEVNHLLADSANALWLSPASIWELLALVGQKRMALHQEMNKWVERRVLELLRKEAPLTWEMAKELRFTLIDHRDPADRFLLATA
jgi:PIN domain nuclease of toxin-antitoxin system